MTSVALRPDMPSFARKPAASGLTTSAAAALPPAWTAPGASAPLAQPATRSNDATPVASSRSGLREDRVGRWVGSGRFVMVPTVHEDLQHSTKGS